MNFNWILDENIAREEKTENLNIDRIPNCINKLCLIFKNNEIRLLEKATLSINLHT